MERDLETMDEINIIMFVSLRYIRKPDFMCRTDRSFDPFAESTVDGIIAGSVEVKVRVQCCYTII